MPAVLALLCLPAAWAAEGSLLIAPQGNPLPGTTADLELVAWDDELAPLNGPLPQVQAAAGEILSVTAGDRAGVWDIRWRVPEAGEEGQLVVDLEGRAPVPFSLSLGMPAESRLKADPVVRGRAGAGVPVAIAITGEGLPAPEDLEVMASEGEVVEVQSTEGGLTVLWQPADVRLARVVPVAIRDGKSGDGPPVWVSVRLRARVPVAVTTDPGTELTVKVGGRTYGPVLADDEGRASTVVDLWPGEQRAEATLSDDLGNVQHTPIVLPGSNEPTLFAVVGGVLVAGAPPPPIFLRAVDGSGKAWAGGDPECRGTGVGTLGVWDTGEGTWRAEIPRHLDVYAQDLRVDCALPGTAGRWTLRIPAGRGVPQHVVLRVYPAELTRDFPVAQVQAFVEDMAGDRLLPTHLALVAEHGELSLQPEDGLRISADYTAAPETLIDQIEARWTYPLGKGSPWRLVIGQDAEGSILVRALDRQALPLGRVPVTLELPAGQKHGETNERGWLVVPWDHPEAPAVIEARAAEVVQRAFFLPWTGLPLGDPQAPDLVASQEIRVQAGRVREVYIAAEPGVVHTGGTETARVTVRLLDRVGEAVRDEVVQLNADRGSLSEIQIQPDGSMEATYQPPKGLATGRVELRAQGTDGSFAATTTLMLRPRPVRHSLSVVTGVLAGPGPRVSPLVALDYETHFPMVERGLYLRISAGSWVARTTVPDPDRGGDVELRMEMLSLSASILARWERDLWTIWAGTGPQLVPYRLQIRYPGVNPVSGLGLHQPGLVGFVGGGRRLRPGEVFAELRGLGVTAYTEDFGYEGQVGGVAAVAGFRLIF